MKNSIKPREDFYAPELNMDRVKQVLNHVIENLTLTEVLKMVRQISYDMICYYDDDLKGYIYKGGHTEENINQASRLQSLLRSACDLFGQSVVDKRVMEEEYLERYNMSGELSNKVKRLESEVARLQKIIDEEKY